MRCDHSSSHVTRSLALMTTAMLAATVSLAHPAGAIKTGETTELFRTDDAGTSWLEQCAPAPTRKLYFLDKSMDWTVTNERRRNTQN